MSETPTIRKISPPHPGMDFQGLRREGIERIIALSSDLWTDYNIHDPGITLLEVLCYAVTDLSYRANLPIEDLLAAHSGSMPPPGLPPAGEVLTCHPVTAMDWRKLLIDIEGVKNAWVYKDEDAVPKFEIDTKSGKIVFSGDISLNGLMQVRIDFDDAISASSKSVYEERVLATVRERLHAYRNLCEDFTQIDDVSVCGVQLCAALEIDEESNPNEIMAELRYRIQEFLTPTPRFYGLEEMLQRKGTRSFEELFEGPLLENGFIDEAELAASKLRSEVNVSDLYTVLKEIPGVTRVWGVKIRKTKSDPTEKNWEEGKLTIEALNKPVLDVTGSDVKLRRRNQPVFVDAIETAALLERLQWKNRPMSARDRMDIPYPKATARPDLEDYFSIQNDLPHTFHVDQYGLEESAPTAHHAQVRQLKAFLTIFDQILANYLTHLGQVKYLLRMEQDAHGATLFGKSLYEEVPDIGKVLIGFDAETGKAAAYDDFLKQQLETPDQIARRRNAVMEHLIARFGEVFTDYALTVFFDDPRTGWTAEDYAQRVERNLDEKADFLKHIPRLSRERGKGFNYRLRKPNGSPDIWDTGNVEGLKRRVCLLLGIPQVNRATITCPPAYDLQFRKEGKKYGFILKSANRKKAPPLLEAVAQTTEKRIKENAGILMNALVRTVNYEVLKETEELFPNLSAELQSKVGGINNKWQPEDKTKPVADFILQPAPNETYRLCILDSKRKIIAQSYAGLKTTEELKNLLLELKAIAFNEDCEAAGFHIVEHILLRPRHKDCCKDHPALVLQKGTGTPPTTTKVPDPYSFWITVVAADAWQHFQHPANRQVFEQTLRMETPAHIGVRICWLSNEEMYEFEVAYGRWLTELNNPKPDRCDLDEQAKLFTEVLNGLSCPVCCGADEAPMDLLCKPTT